MRIKLNTMVKVITVNGDELIGTYKGIGITGINLKDVKLISKNNNKELNMLEGYIEFNKINEVIPQKED